MSSLSLTEIVLDAEREPVVELASVIARVKKEARKKGVFAVRFSLDLDGGLALEGEATDRGETLVVTLGRERRRYPLTVDGMENALADVVRVVHRSDAAILDAYERVLVGRLRGR